jgi:hypothetical protein
MPQAESHTMRAMGHRLYLFFVVALFCNQSNLIHIVLLTTTEVLIGH